MTDTLELIVIFLLIIFGGGGLLWIQIDMHTRRKRREMAVWQMRVNEKERRQEQPQAKSHTQIVTNDMLDFDEDK